MKRFRVGVIGGTGMVGQRFVSLIANHPWFELAEIAASSKSSGRPYAEVMDGRWRIECDMPELAKNIIVKDASDVKSVADNVDFVFSAVDMKHDEILALEEEYAKAECPVVSNNSAHRWTADVPMIIPEVNPEQSEVIAFQKKRLGTSKGFIAVKSNCSIQSYVPALSCFRETYGLSKILACTYQAISGAGKNFETWPEMVDNVIPFIDGEEEKSEREPLKVWGSIKNGIIVNAEKPVITTQCIRVPVLNGHMAAVFVSFDNKPQAEEIIKIWNEYEALPQKLRLPSAPLHCIKYFDDPARPQTRLDRMNENGMQVSVGRLRPDSLFDYKFVCLSHNTVRGAAGGAVLLAELLCKQNYIK